LKRTDFSSIFKRRQTCGHAFYLIDFKGRNTMLLRHAAV